MDLLCKKSASDLANLISKKEVSSKEVVEAHLNRISEVNPHINAITIILKESSLEAANAADNASDEDRERLFHGVPFTVKENIDLIGTPTTQGLPILAEAMPPNNAPIVDRMIKAGAIPIARTNLPELGLRLDTDNPLRGRTKNPWNPNLTPGGSSGGEAAALATGMTPFGLGNDIGGSVRNPAYCCGVASLKPSIGRIPFVSSIEPKDIGVSRSFVSDGPMARSVSDLKTGLSILSGRHISDPDSVDIPLSGPLPEKFKAAIVKNIPGFDIPKATEIELERAKEILSDKGWIVEEVEAPELERVFEIWASILSPGIFQVVPPEVFKKETADYLERAGEQFVDNIVPLEEALIERQRLRRLWSEFLTEYSVCIGPTWTNLPWPIDTDLDPDTGIDTLKKSFAFIVPGNCLGFPSIALPTGVSDGLPTGIQIYSELYREDLCFLAAEIIEKESTCPTPIDPIV
ncbi:MAG: indole acetimide hydrolase [Rhodobiaceae bacterium]|nr:indole acetimide hydrolase [Rhodobiaceae bacterium]